MRQIKNMQEQKHQSKTVVIVSFFLKNLLRNTNAFALKFISDYMFIIVEKIITKLPSLLLPYINYYKDTVENEINLAKITKKDTVLHIGCGPLPATSFLVAKITGSHVIGIDKNPHSVQNAQNCVHVLHQENQIQIQHANALDYSINSSDVIIISQGIEPRYEVLEHIANTIGSDTRVIFRTFSSKDGGITPEDAVLKTLFTVRDVVSQPPHGILISILLSKKTKV
jgi:threonine dehydrogenase-like Zn-dependent dehydrogenase